MAELEKEPEMSKWLSTYGLVTAERVLERFNIHLKANELIDAIKNPQSIYYKLLQIPLKNILNGIVLQQTKDYQIHAQKQFVDYFLSGQNDKDEHAQGANVRDDLEVERTSLISIGDALAELEIVYQKLIAESQASLMSASSNLNLLQTNLEILNPILETYGHQVENMSTRLRDFRRELQQKIIQVAKLINLLPDYQLDEKREKGNMAELDFDSHIGG